MINNMSLTQKDIAKIAQLREHGYSVPEIAEATSHSKSTVLRYVQGVPISEKYLKLWKSKRGGSKTRAETKWRVARKTTEDLFTIKSLKEQLIIIACLYWAEGSKKEFGFSNTDPAMIAVLVECLKSFGIKPNELKVSIRIYGDMVNRQEIIAKFWAHTIGIPVSQITKFDVLEGRKEGKLQYGMCRMRITKSERIFKIIQSAVSLLQEKYVPIAQRIEQQTPKL